MSKKSILLSQVFMTLIMAGCMSGIMGLIFAGPTLEWLVSWPKQFVLAWPIAFALTMVAWPLSMKAAAAVLKTRRGGGASTSA